MRIPLSRHRIHVLSIAADYKSDDDILEMLGQGQSEPVVHRHVIEVGGYRRNQDWHQVILSGTRHDSEWGLHLVYSCPAVNDNALGPPPSSVRSGMIQLQEILQSQTLRGLEPGAGDIGVATAHRFNAGSVIPIVPLPFLRNNDPHGAFTEARGITLEKQGRLSEAYSAELSFDAERNQIILGLSFTVLGRLDNNTPRIAMQRANTITKRLITQLGVQDE